MSRIPQETERDIRHAAELLKSCKHGVALTGAGISTPSGIPDFRSAGSGLWNRFDPFEVASLSAFRYHPERFFDWMRTLARGIVQAAPNPAHLALAELEAAGIIQTTITQNIDGLHQRAGSRCVLEVHGTLNTLTCIGCYHQYEASGFLQPYLNNGIIPRCPDCNQILKPDVILFEEQLPLETWLKARQACRNSDLILVAGSSLEVVPVAGLPMQALENGARLIIVNHMSTYLDVRADVIFREDVAEILPCLSEMVIGG
jgi:NAD-dependent deacetylase